jgi:hypothetical protein
MDKTQFVIIEDNRTKHIYTAFHIQLRVNFPLSRKNDYTCRFFNNNKNGGVLTFYQSYQ